MTRSGVKVAVVLAVISALFWWVLRDVVWSDFWEAIRNADVLMLGLAVVVTTLGFPVRAIRWRLFLDRVDPKSSFRPRFAAVCIGFMANNLLTIGRVGEFARAFAYGRLTPVPSVTAFATIVVERIVDGVAILALLFIALASPAFPADSLHPAVESGVTGITWIIGLLLPICVFLVVAPDRGSRLLKSAGQLLPKRFQGKLANGVASFVEGVQCLKGARQMLLALLWSFGLWALQSFSFWLGFRAFDVDLPYTAALFLNAVIAFAVAVPVQAPGFVGSLQVAASLALVEVYGAAEAPVLAFALAWNLGSFFPITFMGLWYARRIGMSFRQMKGGPEGGEESKAKAQR